MFKALFISFNILCGADSVTTHIGLNTHQVHEVGWAGGISQNPFTLDAMNAGQCIAVNVGSKKLPKKVSIPILIGSIAVRGWEVKNNIQVIRQGVR